MLKQGEKKKAEQTPEAEYKETDQNVVLPQSEPTEFEKIFSSFITKLENVINNKEVSAFVSTHNVTKRVVDELGDKIKNPPKTKESFDEINQWLIKKIGQAS